MALREKSRQPEAAKKAGAKRPSSGGQRRKLGLLDLPLLLASSMALSYALFSTLAALRFPGDYGPWNNNTLSQLGNANLNPQGAIFYWYGCGIAGFFAVAFFLSLHLWYRSWTPRQNRILIVIQLLGVAGGIGLFLQGIFPETNYTTHHILAGVDFNSFAVAMILAPVALWRRGRTNLPIAAFCLLAFVAVIVMFVFARSHWVEWLPVVMFLVFPPFTAFLVHIRAETAGADRRRRGARLWQG